MSVAKYTKNIGFEFGLPLANLSINRISCLGKPKSYTNLYGIPSAVNNRYGTVLWKTVIATLLTAWL